MTNDVPRMASRDSACLVFETRLMAYLENELSIAEHAEMAQHRRTCAACDGVVRELSTIVHDARTLPPLAPARELWDGINARLDSTVIATLDGRSAGTTQAIASATRSRTISLRWIAIAASMMVAMTSAITWRIARSGQLAVTAGSVAARADVDAIPASIDSDGTRAMTTAVGVGNVESVYEDEIAMLRVIVNARMRDLDSTTVHELQRNLAIIDKAIADSREALTKDPNSRASSGALDHALTTKLALLRRVALL